MPELRTERLLLRRWRRDDRAPFAALNADPEVMRHFPAPMSREESDAVPGGEDYTRVPSDTGRVRDRPQAVEQQKQLSG